MKNAGSSWFKRAAAVAVWASMALPALSDEMPIAVRLYMNFQHEPAAHVLETMKAELQSIMAPAGIALEWRSLNRNEIDAASSLLAVMHFSGSCEPGAVQQASPPGGALGLTHVVDGRIVPFSNVDCDKVWNVLVRGIVCLPGRKWEGAFGRALARVSAHELYHILARTARHSSSGLARPWFTEIELLSDKLRFGEKDCNALRAGSAKQLGGR
jgi:hypothetical protein